MKVHFITYGDKKFYLSKLHIINLAKRSEFFDTYKSFGPRNLDNEFLNNNFSILQNSTGGGYWLWKYKILKDTLEQLPENDILVYCDAGASINYLPKAKDRFQEYIDILCDKNTSHLRMECEPQYIEKNWTTREIFDYFNVDINSSIANSTQLQAGHMFFKKCTETIEYFNDYEEIITKDKHLITDYYDSNQVHKGFIENRHDQSLFSVLSKIYNAYIIENETEFKHRPDKKYDFTFLSLRTYGHGIKDYIDFLLLNRSRLNETKFFDE